MRETSLELSPVICRTPAAWAAVLFSSGIALEPIYARAFPAGGLLLLLLVCVCCLIPLERFSRFGKAWRISLLLNLTGAVWQYQSWEIAPAQEIARYATESGTPIRIEGRALEDARLLPANRPAFASAFPAEDRIRFELESTRVGFPDFQQEVCGKVRVTIRGQSHELPRAGELVIVTGELRTLPQNRNPGTYDFSGELRREGIHSLLFCEHPDGLERTTEASQRFVVSFSGIARVRSAIREKFSRLLPASSAALAEALILGERQGIDLETMTSFRKSGLMHLLSISGMHVAMIGACGFLLGRLLFPSSRAANLLMFLGMTVACLLAEFRPPVFRAWIFGGLVCYGWSAYRPMNGMQITGLAALVCLIVNPGWLFNPGFQLSFLAIIALVCGMRWLPGVTAEDELSQGVLQQVTQFALRSVAMSALITVALLPVTAFHFHLISVGGILGTACSAPLLMLTLPLLLLMSFLALLWEPLSYPFIYPAHWGLNLLQLFADWFSGTTWNWLPAQPHWSLSLIMIALGLFFVLAHQKTFRRQKQLLIGLATLLILLAHHPVLRAWGTQNLECRLVSVGHGNAFLVRCPNGRSILFDAGSMEDGRIAAQSVREHLSELGCNRLDAIVISHTDADHLNAVPFLLDDIPVHTVFVNPIGLSPEHKGMKETFERGSKRGVSFRPLQQADLLELDSSVRISAMQCADFPDQFPGSDNENSIVMLLEYAGRRLLIPGDLSGDGQQRLFRQTLPDCDLLLSPHHGSKKDNTQSFAEWSKPRFVLVSTGRLETGEHLQQIYPQSTILSTDAGAIRCRITPQGELNVSQWNPGQHA
ncbi:MAG: ComEC/Rec2 family competence protein, partial [Planctomycetaceae bacterium]|nr:ComEC/Rec2 family competence protein [Planctomycetaceae bacterium]